MQKADRRRRLFGKALSVVVGFSILCAGVGATFLLPGQWGYLDPIQSGLAAVILGAAWWGSVRVAGKIQRHYDPPIPWEHQMVRESAEHRAKYPDLYPPNGR